MCTKTQRYWRDNALPFVELRSTYDSRQAYKPHFHSELSFGAVIAGETRASCGGHEMLLREGDLVLVAPHAVHACNPVAGRARSYHMLFLDEPWCGENVLALRGRSLMDACGDLSVIRDERLFAQYLELVTRLPSVCATAATAELQLLLTAAVERSRSASSPQQEAPLAGRIKQALLESIESGATLDDVSHALRCRKETLIRVFRRTYHTTPHAFVNNTRIERAKQGLKAGGSIADVAVDLGFSDQAQLHRTFVSYTASTPGQYRSASARSGVNFRQ